MLDALGAARPMIAQGLVAPTVQYRNRDHSAIAAFDFGLIADATRHPFRLQCEQFKLTRIMPYASTGPGTTPHLSMVTFARAAGLGMSHVSYRGPGDVMVAFQQGQVQVFNDHPSSLKANGLHAIAVLAPERFADSPGTPTMREQGFDVNFSIWHGLFAPAATPPAVVARYEAACERAVQAPAVREGHERIQTPIVFRNARDFAASVAADSERMRTIIEEGGLRQAE